MTTSIIQLDSSPKQHRKLYHTLANPERHRYSNNNNNHQHNHSKFSEDLTTTGSNWSNDVIANSPYEKYSNSLSSRQSFSTLTSPELFSRHKHYLVHDDRKQLDYVDHKTSMNLLDSSQNDNYFNLSSNYISHSESGSLQNISTSFKSNKSCDKYGFFIESEEDYETPSVQDLKEIRLKEKKWLQMLNNWRYYINFKWEKIRDRCRKGIPHSLRSQAWFHLCGAHLQKNRFPNLYSELLTKDIPDDVINDIRKDLHRQFPNHEMFADPNGIGQTDLFNVLKAFSAYKPNMGYCQAQAPIAAVFLMHMPAEKAFWCLVALSKYYISGYFVHNLEDIKIHGQMLFAFLKKYCSSAYNLLNRQDIPPELYMMEWFMCIYSRNLPWPSVLRVWDMFLCEGLTVLFKVGLYLVEVALKNENTKTCPTMSETYQKLRNIPNHYLAEESLIKGIKKFELRDIDLLKEHKIQLKKFHKSKNKKK